MTHYMCKRDGHVTAIEIGEDGSRVCPNCAREVVKVETLFRDTVRSPPVGESQASGDILWDVYHRDGAFSVQAFDVDEAAELAADRVSNPQKIERIQPAVEDFTSY